MPTKTRKPPWKRSAPTRKAKTTLSPTEKKRAQARARRAGRRYPNLVDNMREAGKARKHRRSDSATKAKTKTKAKTTTAATTKR